jgi:hypothetical protein
VHDNCPDVAPLQHLVEGADVTCDHAIEIACGRRHLSVQQLLDLELLVGRREVAHQVFGVPGRRGFPVRGVPLTVH